MASKRKTLVRRAAFFALLTLAFTCATYWSQPEVRAAVPETGTNAPSHAIPATFFGMNVHVWATQDQPWPAVQFGSFRFWDSGTGWAQLNPAKDRYDWTQLDRWFTLLHAHNVDDALYTFGRVPGFASSKPSDRNCAYGAGQCDPPSDLNADGAGSDQYWKDFVEAIVTHCKSSQTVHVRYWEIWNEPYLPSFWTGTMPQMVRMAADAQSIIHRIDPDAIVLNPPGPLRFARYQDFMANYLAAGGGKYADAIAFHGYVHGKPGVHSTASDFLTYLTEFRKVLAQYGQESKPLWDTEASWGNEEVFLPDQDMQAAFVAQFYLLHWSQGIERLYWYAYNDGAVGRLWIPDAYSPSRPGRVTAAGKAYAELYSWLVGVTMTQPCAQDGSKWTCGITKDGHEAQIVWSPDSEQSYTPKATFKKMRDLDRATTQISGPIKIGPKPILLESQP